MFDLPSRKQPAPETPEELFYSLKRHSSVPHLWTQQGEVLKTYLTKHLQSPDVALELPTGCGKTLIGLLLAEWRRRKFSERIVYMCPTKQLAHQVASRAATYGISVATLTAKKKEMPAHEVAAYHSSEKIAVAVYSAVFNMAPEFTDAEVLILDDAHASENYIAGMWSLSVRRSDFEVIYDAIVDLLRNAITDSLYAAIRNTHSRHFDPKNVQLVPLPLYWDLIPEMRQLLDSLCKEGELYWRWSALRESLESCLFYVSPDRLLLRPYIPPTLTHQPFSGARQRLYMSATLGAGGDLERFTGIASISRMEAPEAWKTRVTGRRFIVFASQMNEDVNRTDAVIQLCKEGPRTLVLAEDRRTVDALAKSLNDAGVSTLAAKDVEESIDPFIQAETPSALVLANRYDGIDLPDETCRQMVMMGTPTSGDLQEQFLLQRFQATSLLRDRIRTRLTQGVGRCTRSETDYALVLMFGDDLHNWCAKPSNKSTLKPELQAEIALGMSAARNGSLKDFLDRRTEFLQQGSEWLKADDWINEDTKAVAWVDDPVAETLRSVVDLEVKWMYSCWQHDFAHGYELAVRIGDKMDSSLDLRPYRTFWNFCAASSAYAEFSKTGNEEWRSRYKSSIRKAADATLAISWFATLKRLLDQQGEAAPSGPPVIVEQIANLLDQWHLNGPKFEERLGEARSWILSNNATSFEMGLEALGKMLGCESFRWNPGKDKGAPDGLWLLVDGSPIIWEAKSDADPKVPVTLEYAREAGGHEAWIHHWNDALDMRTSRTIFVTPSVEIRKEAEGHALPLFYLSPASVRDLFAVAADLILSVRNQCKAISDEQRLQTIQKMYVDAGLDHVSLLKKLLVQKLGDLPKV